jgi:hypothetical protein
MGKASKTKSDARLKSQRILRGLGLSPHSSGAQTRVGDKRDAKRVEHLVKKFKDTGEIPKFLTVPDRSGAQPSPPLSIRASGFRSS